MKLLYKGTVAYLLLLICLFAGDTSFIYAQNNPLNIPGTRVSIIPPAGYKASVGFKGLEKSNDIFIKVYDPYNTNYVKYAQGFTRESLENGGSEVQEYRKLNISGMPAKYAVLENNIGGKTFYLVFGDSTFSVMVVASCPANKDSDAIQLKKAITSVTYNKSLKTDPMSGAFFSVNDKDTSFKFAKFKNDFYIYSNNGVISDPYSGESIVSILPFTSEYVVGNETIAKAIVNSYQQYGITEAKIKKETQIKIGTLDAIETEANAKVDNKKAVIYSVTVVDGKKALLILGIATSNFDKNINEFRTLAQTVKFN